MFHVCASWGWNGEEDDDEEISNAVIAFSLCHYHLHLGIIKKTDPSLEELPLSGDVKFGWFG